MIGERNVIEIMIGVVGVESGPCAVSALQSLDPFARARDRLGMSVRGAAHAAAIGAVHRHRHHGGVVGVGIMRVGVLERPAARPDVRTPGGPVALDVEDLERLEPVERRPHRLGAGVAAGFEQRVGGERGVPDRRQAGLAIGLVLADDEEPLDRLTRRDEMGMIGRVAERVEHQHRVRHRRIDRAEAVLRH